MPTFDNLVESVHKAVLSATDLAEKHELASLEQEEFWYRVTDNKGNPLTDDEGNPVYKPKLVTLRMPMWDDGKLIEKDVQVPMQSLTTGQSLRIGELTVEMEVEMQGLDESNPDNNCLMVSTSTGGGLLKKKASTARVSVTFTGQDPPEGYARIDNQLIKLLP
ncbi:MAG: DUF2589 domain-containing protein [Chlamydiota bacterium]|nr:DUF2589 domain-containing protein [Chlamydiota bacterium]